MLLRSGFQQNATRGWGRISLDCIRQLKAAGTNEVVTPQVINQQIIDGLVRHATVDKAIAGWKAKTRQVAEESLDDIGKTLESMGLKVKKVIKTGYPAREILQTEMDEGVSMIIIGSHGRTNLSEMLLGSVSEKVIRKGKNPVLVIKRKTTD